MWSAHSYYMVEVMLVRYVNINARCRASGVLVPLACAVRLADGESAGDVCLADDKIAFIYKYAPDGYALCAADAADGSVFVQEDYTEIGQIDFTGDKIKVVLNDDGEDWVMLRSNA